MDPQQRHLLEVAYQALESANYFNGPKPPSKDVGCYIGVCANDYADNVASHPPNAFSTLGTLRAFLAGRISNFFGWTGESSTIDTACSSSAVAINKACTDIIAGKCTAALAGGVNVFTSPNFFQNLNAGKFLSTTGQCKSFDAKADGYCRGEGVGLLLLKKLSEAQASGDKILAVIPGSAVRQNSNETYITVPHGPSQSDLYEEVLRFSRMTPDDVTYVEAHGTGTPVGDPIEFESIRRTFGGLRRQTEQLLHVGSIKANIGHTESASGVAAVIKAVLMIHHKRIPPQASFTTLNPQITLSESDRIAITTTGIEWKSSGPLTVCVNNYGASGSNAALIVTEPPSPCVAITRTTNNSRLPKAIPFPFIVTASSQQSLSANIGVLRKQILKQFTMSPNQQEQARLADLSFSVVSGQNPSLPFAATFDAASMDQLIERLHESSTSDIWNVTLPSKSRPVVMAFGGQNSKFVGLDKDKYESCALLRHHLDCCQNELKSQGFPGILPYIFQSEPIEDPVILHSALFSVQYSCAKAWIDSGLTVAKLVGHSFGELTATCVSGILSLSDGLKLVAGRARLMKEKWGPDPGSMLLVETDPVSLGRLLNSDTVNVEVACHNGPRLTVISGSKSEVEHAEQFIKLDPTTQNAKSKILDVPYAFHSRFTEPILHDLEVLAGGLVFRKPFIPVETCLDRDTECLPWPQRVREHTRRPVFFHQAVSKIHEELAGCCWLEAGMNSGITTMARRALGEEASEHTFYGMNLRDRTPLRDSLTQVTIGLWKESQSVTFWDFHTCQRGMYSYVPFLPPYQFEKSRHWLEWRDTVGPLEFDSSAKNNSTTPAPRRLLTLTRKTEANLEFNVDPQHDTWKGLIQGHAVVGQPLCPAPLYMELAAQAALTALGHEETKGFSATWKKIQIDEALGLGEGCRIVLSLSKIEHSQSWKFCVTSSSLADPQLRPSMHASGEVSLVSKQDAEDDSEFPHYETALRHTVRQLQAADVTDTVALRGPLVYSVFSRVVTYDEMYKGVWDIFAKGDEAISRVKLASECNLEGFDKMITDPLALDNFVQVSGIHVNALSGLCSENEVFVCTRITKVEIHPSFSLTPSRQWKVLSMYREYDPRNIDNDIYVYDEATGKIVVVIHGARFTRMLIKSLVRALSSKNAGGKVGGVVVEDFQEKKMEDSVPAIDFQSQTAVSRADDTPSKVVSDEDVFCLLARVAEIDLGAIANDASLADLGIDSLLSSEVLNEVNETFLVDLSADEYQSLLSVGDLVQCIRARSPSANAIRLMTSPPTRGASPTFSEANDPESTGSSTPTSTSSEFAVMKLESKTQSFDDVGGSESLRRAYEVFKDIKNGSDDYAKTYGSIRFWDDVYPIQASLVTQYVVDALPQLGCDLSVFKAGDELPTIQYLPKYALLASQLFEILEDARLVRRKGNVWVRADTPVPKQSVVERLQEAVQRFPRHASEHKLLNITGSSLADCMTGVADPLTLVFRNKENANILEDVYTNGPFYLAASKQLCSFLEKALSALKKGNGKPIYILEIGGGTASTTKHVLRMLGDAGIPFVYTFTDVSAGLVAGAKKKLPGLLSQSTGRLEFQTLNATKSPPTDMTGKFDLVLSTNCIHATADLSVSLTNIRQMLKPHGIVTLVEFTKNLFWFDLVFGLMDGWWSMTDGRKHVLADEFFWKRSFEQAGFGHVDWTGGELAESNMLRIITGFKTRPDVGDIVPKKRFDIQTVMFKQTGQNRLFADVYLPPSDELMSQTWSVDIGLIVTRSRALNRSLGLLFHGGGHISLSRHDINTKHVQRLLDNGILPVAVDYRLCPEMPLPEGAMADACSALQWARHELPFMNLNRPGLRIGPKVVGIGWSSGGHLAMTLAWTSLEQRIEPPNAILAFYSPSKLEDESWFQPNFPSGTQSLAKGGYDLLEAVQNYPITESRVMKNGRPVAPGKWLGRGPSGTNPRTTIILHGNWKGQLLPIWLDGLPSKGQIPQSASTSDYETLQRPTRERIMAISPHAQVINGTYRTPTFLVHGTEDDLVPVQQARDMSESLAAHGVESGIAIIDGASHLLDLDEDSNGSIAAEVEKGFAFLRHVVA
ncbi:Methylphloroacetophenone synthase [Colletotrichum fructicola]|nr:Methylphloroacetophenone synthase [Colletotrichum fructicola]KAF4911295.1 Methylphloroacetophenone synthase [Colletotrichum fructicola]